MSTVKEWPICRTLITKTNARVSDNSVEVCLRVCLLHPKPAGSRKAAFSGHHKEPTKLQWIESTLLYLSSKVFMASLTDRVLP